MSSHFPASPPPLSSQDTYTTWPGGVDPTARVFDSVGGAKKRHASRKHQKKTHKKTHSSRKHRRASKRSRLTRRRK